MTPLENNREGSGSDDEDHDYEVEEHDQDLREEDCFGMGNEVEEQEEEDNRGRKRQHLIAAKGSGMQKKQATVGGAVMKAGSSMFGAMGDSNKAIHVAELPTIAGGTALPAGAVSFFQCMPDVNVDGLGLGIQNDGPSLPFNCTFADYLVVSPEMKALIKERFALELQERRLAVQKEQLSMRLMQGSQNPSTGDSGN